MSHMLQRFVDHLIHKKRLFHEYFVKRACNQTAIEPLTPVNLHMKITSATLNTEIRKKKKREKMCMTAIPCVPGCGLRFTKLP